MTAGHDDKIGTKTDAQKRQKPHAQAQTQSATTLPTTAQPAATEPAAADRPGPGWHGGRKPARDEPARQTWHGKQSGSTDRGRESEQTQAHRTSGAKETRSSASAEKEQIDQHVDLAFVALADPTRRQVLEAIAQGRPLSASALAADLPVSRQAVAQHLLVLQQAGLVESRRAGREVLFSVRPDGLTRTASWMTTLAETWETRLQMLKQAAESPGDPKSS